MSTLDIGVIYTHEREFMPRLLDTMSAAAVGVGCRLILVDNASADGVQQWRDQFADTVVIDNCRRLSYAQNLNRIVEKSTARYVLLMNTDMYFDPGKQCLREMVEFMNRRPRCGVAGCRLLHADGTDAHAARRFQTPALIFARRLAPRRVFQRLIDRHFYAEHDPRETWNCDWLSGCFLMVRREAIREVGRFDESFGKYFEDVDICLRMARAGWEVAYHGAASCYHLEQRASKKLLSADAWLHLKAYRLWLRKWGLHPNSAPETVPDRRRAA